MFEEHEGPLGDERWDRYLAQIAYYVHQPYRSDEELPPTPEHFLLYGPHRVKPDPEDDREMTPEEVRGLGRLLNDHRNLG